MKWKDLKGILDAMEPSELNQNIYVVSNSEVVPVDGVEVLEEALYYKDLGYIKRAYDESDLPDTVWSADYHLVGDVGTTILVGRDS